MKTNIDWYFSTDVPKGDIYYCLIMRKQILGEIKFNEPALGVYKCSTDEFWSNGELINNNDISSYGIIDIPQKLIMI